MSARVSPEERPFAAGWFAAWLGIFLVGAICGIVIVAIGPIHQMQVIGGAAFVCALLGAVVCAIGVRLYNPARWREIAGHVTGLGESLRGATEAIGEPRQAAYARAVPVNAQRPGI